MAKAFSRTTSTNANVIMQKNKSVEVTLGEAIKKEKKEKFRKNILSVPDASIIPEVAESHIPSHVFKDSDDYYQQEPRSHQASRVRKIEIELEPKSHDIIRIGREKSQDVAGKDYFTPQGIKVNKAEKQLSFAHGSFEVDIGERSFES